MQPGRIEFVVSVLRCRLGQIGGSTSALGQKETLGKLVADVRFGAVSRHRTPNFGESASIDRVPHDPPLKTRPRRPPHSKRNGD